MDNDMAGEAIEVVDPSGQPIIVLRRTAPPPKNFIGVASLPYGAFSRSYIRLDAADPSYMKALADFDGVCETSATPALVRFGSPSDPATLEVIEYGSDLPVDIVRIEVETTSAPVTDDIASSLPWLEGMAENTNIRTRSVDSTLPSGGYAGTCPVQQKPRAPDASRDV